ncbi:hypothetical protein [Ralstonia sp. 1138]|uniref:hypothetical protein n=1 Tax=Ralstonia sp. 1138 TaxID=3156423 RepID=UPI00339902FF
MIGLKTIVALLGIAAFAGCSSLASEGTSAAAGVGGAALAAKLTNNAAVATGIGLGVQAGARAALQYEQRVVHAHTQDQIAQVAGPLSLNAVGTWRVHHKVPLEADEHGRVVVTRKIDRSLTGCKEILFSVDGDADQVDFFVVTICHDGRQWKWATAEPATGRWGALQ